jgi:hypothetical protein
MKNPDLLADKYALESAMAIWESLNFGKDANSLTP